MVIYTSLKIKSNEDQYQDKFEVPLSFFSLKGYEKVCIAHIEDIDDNRLSRCLSFDNSEKLENDSIREMQHDILIYMKIDYIQTKIMNLIDQNSKKLDSNVSRKGSKENRAHCKIHTKSMTPQLTNITNQKNKTKNMYINLGQLLKRKGSHQMNSNDISFMSKCFLFLICNIDNNPSDINYSFSQSRRTGRSKNTTKTRCSSQLPQSNHSRQRNIKQMRDGTRFSKEARLRYSDFLSRSKERIEKMSYMLHPYESSNFHTIKNVKHQANSNSLPKNVLKESCSNAPCPLIYPIKNQLDQNQFNTIYSENIDKCYSNDFNKNKKIHDKAQMLEMLLEQKDKEIYELKTKLEKYKLSYKVVYKILESPLKYQSTKKPRFVKKESNGSPSKYSSICYDSVN